MNLDYIEIAQFIGKDKPNFHNMEREAMYQNAERYSFQGCRKIEVWNYPESNQIKIKGSIPYFVNGHNYYSSIDDWIEGIEYLQGSLNINIFSGLVNCFEFGTIQEIPFSESEFLMNHIKAKGMLTRVYQKGNILTGKEFDSPSLKIKIYDVNRNIKNKLDKPIREEISRLYGYDSKRHYIKLENHYKKPEAHFRGNLYLNELLSSIFQNRLKNDLLKSYKSIMKTGKLIIPKSKADINAGTIPLMILKELESVYNFNTEELIKSKLKALPEEVFSQNDRKARLRTIRDNLKKIMLQGISNYDIIDLLEARTSAN